MVLRSRMSSFFLYCCTKNLHQHLPEKEQEQEQTMKGSDLSLSAGGSKKPGGWKAIAYILGNETFERLATFGLLANFMVYLMKEFHMDQVSASNILNIWSGVTNFAPLVGAFISDAYAGKFWTIAAASVASLLGLVTLTLTAWIPRLHPPACKPEQLQGGCIGPNSAQLGVLITGLAFLTVGTGGIRPCSIPFGMDQFDPTTKEGVKGINSFFNWYYMTFTLIILLTLTLLVYIQDSVSWVLGFGIPTLLMASSIVLFFIGKRIYVHAKPQGSIFTSIVRVFVAAYKKRHLKLPAEEKEIGVFYDPPNEKVKSLSKLPYTNQFRFLNKAAIIMENERISDGSPDKWRLCSIQEVEEVKCIIRIIPIWASGIISFTSMVQQGTFTLSQALKMDRHLGPNFQVPAASISVISMLTIAIFLPIYDRIIVPALRKITKRESGITLLQRIGIGIFFSILAMIVAGLIEEMRRTSAVLHPGVKPISVFWLSPQLIIMGFCEAFNIIGQLELFNKEFPEHMRSMGNALLFCSIAGSSYLSSIIVNVVHHVTGGHGRPDWLTSDINAGRLDYFYYVLAVMGTFNFIYFLYVAHQYRYKGSGGRMEDKSDSDDVELSSMKP